MLCDEQVIETHTRIIVDPNPFWSIKRQSIDNSINSKSLFAVNQLINWREVIIRENKSVDQRKKIY